MGRERERWRKREKECKTEYGIQTALVLSNLVFYTQSTSTVISGRNTDRKGWKKRRREREREGEREEERERDRQRDGQKVRKNEWVEYRHTERDGGRWEEREREMEKKRKRMQEYGIQTALVLSNLAFYTQSTSTVISG